MLQKSEKMSHSSISQTEFLPPKKNGSAQTNGFNQWFGGETIPPNYALLCNP
jgi:hypothetical protein